MALLSTVSRSNWNLEMLVFVEGGKTEYPEKNPRSRGENRNNKHVQIQVRYIKTTKLLSSLEHGHFVNSNREGEEFLKNVKKLWCCVGGGGGGG